MSVSTTTRWDVFAADNFTCQHCGARRDLEVDHIVPRCRGGGDERANLQTLCGRCNRAKGPRPESPSRRVYVGVRLSPGGVANVDSLAAAAGVNRSAMIRTLLGEAIQARSAREVRAVPKSGAR